ncbi:MAG: HAMP domain-containing protein [Nitrospirota bacterium]|nr:HAMP domain-containing protein [Nitrospirota bacterium]
MQRRIIISILLSVLIILLSLGFISYYHIQDTIERSYEDRRGEAGIIATMIDHVLEENLTRLYDISLADKIDLRDGNWTPEEQALQAAYHYSIFSDGIFLLDKLGNVLISYPSREGEAINLLGVPPVSRVISEMRPVISSVFTMEPSRRKVIFALVPLRNKSGDVVGTAGGLIDPTSYHFTRILTSLVLEKRTNIELVDNMGIVIASNHPSSILSGIDHNKFLSKLIDSKQSTVAACHRCHLADASGYQRRTEDILIFSPLDLAPWGVAIRVPRDQVYAPSTSLQRGFVVLAVIALATSFILALGMSKSIVKPVQQLIRATERIARGDLSVPVKIESADEIRTLAEQFDDMRTKLDASLKSIQQYNMELEQRVRDRTRQLEEKQRVNTSLLRKLITSQEDERKRIARELHDDSLQTLSALLMNIEMCRLHPDLITPEKVSVMKQTVTVVINEMTKVIQNLRPTVLDDLGFEAGIVWLIDRNLREKGLHCHVNMQELVEDRIPPEIQLTLFRIFQEATTNIGRHAGAEHVQIHIKNDDHSFFMSIEDDGKGFETESVFENTMTGRGLGIMGMKERATQVNGTLKVCSKQGGGTTVLCTVPLRPEE